MQNYDKEVFLYVLFGLMLFRWSFASIKPKTLSRHEISWALSKENKKAHETQLKQMKFKNKYKSRWNSIKTKKDVSFVYLCLHFNNRIR